MPHWAILAIPLLGLVVRLALFPGQRRLSGWLAIRVAIAGLLLIVVLVRALH